MGLPANAATFPAPVNCRKYRSKWAVRFSGIKITDIFYFRFLLTEIGTRVETLGTYPLKVVQNQLAADNHSTNAPFLLPDAGGRESRHTLIPG